MGLPSFTIVTPCLNGAATLSSTLESVRDQDYGGEVEHVVVDGGSTDGTLDILASAPDVRYISEPDRGLSDAVNKGIRMARNEVVGWLNADDIYLPGALGRVGKALADRPDALWATGPCLIIDADGREIRRFVTGYKSFLLRRYSYRMHLVQNFVPRPRPSSEKRPSTGSVSSTSGSSTRWTTTSGCASAASGRRSWSTRRWRHFAWPRGR